MTPIGGAIVLGLVFAAVYLILQILALVFVKRSRIPFLAWVPLAPAIAFLGYAILFYNNASEAVVGFLMPSWFFAAIICLPLSLFLRARD